MKYILFFTFLILVSCNKKKETDKLPVTAGTNIGLDYAKGFSVTDNGIFKVLEIKSPFPKSERTYTYALINRRRAASVTLPREAYDGIILTPVNSIVVTSTTHLPALELLQVENTLVGFPGTDYISSNVFRDLIELGNVTELGKNESINTEAVLELNPEVVIAFGIDGTSKPLETVAKADIPVIYNGDWVESSPLAKAEWIKFFGVLFEKSVAADSLFNSIETDYLSARELVSGVTKTPSVLSGAIHQDVWYLPNGTSTEAQFFRDANVNYLWKDTSGQGSLALSFESVLEKAKNADLWFSPSYYGDLNELSSANSHYQQFDAFKNKNVYSFVNTVGATGGVIYYELGLARPDLVLKDIIKIAHPGVLPDYEPYFFKRLK